MKEGHFHSPLYLYSERNYDTDKSFMDLVLRHFCNCYEKYHRPFGTYTIKWNGVHIEYLHGLLELGLNAVRVIESYEKRMKVYDLCLVHLDTGTSITLRHHNYASPIDDLFRDVIKKFIHEEGAKYMGHRGKKFAEFRAKLEENKHKNLPRAAKEYDEEYKPATYDVSGHTLNPAFYDKPDLIKPDVSKVPSTNNASISNEPVSTREEVIEKVAKRTFTQTERDNANSRLERALRLYDDSVEYRKREAQQQPVVSEYKKPEELAKDFDGEQLAFVPLPKEETKNEPISKVVSEEHIGDNKSVEETVSERVIESVDAPMTKLQLLKLDIANSRYKHALQNCQNLIDIAEMAISHISSQKIRDSMYDKVAQSIQDILMGDPLLVECKVEKVSGAMLVYLDTLLSKFNNPKSANMVVSHLINRLCSQLVLGLPKDTEESVSE